MLAISVNPCDIPSFKNSDICKGLDTAQAAVSFVQDPLGYIAQQMQNAASGLASTVLPAMEQLTHPDLSAKWFLDAYKVSFALGIFVWVIFLGWNFVQLSRRRISGDDLVESLAFYTPVFFLGALFGPAAGTALMKLTGALSDSISQWGITSSTTASTTALKDAIAAGDSAKIAGGSIVAIIIFLCLIIALIMVFLTLLVMQVTLYLAGAVFPLSAAWLVHPRQRSRGMRIGMVWIGICSAHVLIFLLLGIAFRMAGGLGDSTGNPGTKIDPSLQILANLAVAVIALVMATTAPFGLLAFAPVGASSAPASDPFPDQGRSGGGAVGGGYSESADDSQTAQMARANSSGNAEGLDDAGGGVDAGGGSGGGGLMGMLGTQAGEASSAAMEAGEDEGGGPAGSGGSGGDASSAGSGGIGAGMTGGGGGAEATAGEVGASEGAAAAASGGATLAAGVLAAEASGAQSGDGEDQGEDATGGGGGQGLAGAVRSAGGAALGAAGAVVSTTAAMATTAAVTATEQMEHAYNDEGGN